MIKELILSSFILGGSSSPLLAHKDNEVVYNYSTYYESQLNIALCNGYVSVNGASPIQGQVMLFINYTCNINWSIPSQDSSLTDINLRSIDFNINLWTSNSSGKLFNNGVDLTDISFVDSYQMLVSGSYLSSISVVNQDISFNFNPSYLVVSNIMRLYLNLKLNVNSVNYSPTQDSYNVTSINMVNYNPTSTSSWYIQDLANFDTHIPIYNIIQNAYSNIINANNNAYGYGFAQGELVGFNNGYESGLLDASTSSSPLTSPFGIIGTVFTSIGGILSIQIFPNVTLGLLIALPLIFIILMFIIKHIGGDS